MCKGSDRKGEIVGEKADAIVEGQHLDCLLLTVELPSGECNGIMRFKDNLEDKKGQDWDTNKRSTAGYTVSAIPEQYQERNNNCMKLLNQMWARKRTA